MKKCSGIIMSIKPKFANLIIEGSKRAEFRRVVPKNEISTIVIYSSSPIKSIIGIAKVDQVICSLPKMLFVMTQYFGTGLTEEELLKYFSGKNIGFAFLLGNVRKFKNPVNPHEIFLNFTPPQSFRYITSSELEKLENIL